MNVTAQAKNILQSEYEFRKFPKEAQIEFMRRNRLVLTEEQKQAYREMPDIWTFRRACQKLVESGKVKIEPEIDAYRFKRYQEETAKHRSEKPNYLERHGLVVVDE